MTEIYLRIVARMAEDIARGETMWYLNLHSLPATRVCGNIHARWLSVLLAPGNLETMHDSDLPTFLIISLPIIVKRIE